MKNFPGNLDNYLANEKQENISNHIIYGHEQLNPEHQFWLLTTSYKNLRVWLKLHTFSTVLNLNIKDNPLWKHLRFNYCLNISCSKNIFAWKFFGNRFMLVDLCKNMLIKPNLFRNHIWCSGIHWEGSESGSTCYCDSH